MAPIHARSQRARDYGKFVRNHRICLGSDTNVSRETFSVQEKKIRMMLPQRGDTRIAHGRATVLKAKRRSVLGTPGSTMSEDVH